MTELTKQGIHALLDQNPRAVERAILALYARQTEDEKADKQTKENNGIGFSGADAEFLTDLALQLLGKKPWQKGKPKPLTTAQLVPARKAVKRYWKQLISIAAEKEAQKVSTSKAPKVGPAMTWDDIADFYGQKTGGKARIKPMEEVGNWFDKYVENHPGEFYIDPKEETYHRIEK